MSLELDLELCRQLVVRARTSEQLGRECLAGQLAEQLEVALTEIARTQGIARLAVERAVDAALGEVSRQQGGIAPNVGVEARRDGISCGKALLRGSRAVELDGADRASGTLTDLAVRKFGKYYDLCDEDLEYLLRYVASDSGFLRPLIREIQRRRSEAVDKVAELGAHDR